MFAHRVEKIFHHSGTCGHLNAASPASVFFEHGGQPRKIYSVQAWLASLFPPDCRFVRRLDASEGLRAYLFDRGGRKVLALWSPAGGGFEVEVDTSGALLLDVEGNEIEGGRTPLGPCPCFALSRGKMGEAEFLRGVSIRHSPGAISSASWRGANFGLAARMAKQAATSRSPAATKGKT